MKVKLADIHIGKRFRSESGKDLSDLLEDFQNPEVGQITPITLRTPTEEEIELGVTKPFVLVAGGRRCAAAMLCGWEEIEAFDKGQISLITYRIMELNENLKRKALTWPEECALKDEIFALRKTQNPEITQGEVAREIGEHPGNFSRDLKTHRAIVENPSLKNAATKKAAYGAAQLLAESQAKQLAQKNLNGSGGRPSFTGNIAEKIVTADALDYLPKVPAKSVDLALLDGPYGYNYWKSGQKLLDDEKSLSRYDDDPERTGILYRAAFPLIVRTMRETGWMIFFCGEETYDFLSELAKDCCSTHASYRSNKSPSQCEAATLGGVPGPSSCRFLVPEVPGWIWYRPNSRNQPRYRDLHAKNVYEQLLVINMGKGRIYRWPCNNLLVHDAVYSGRVHANEKPMSLYKDLIERLSMPGDMVLDCFYGSGNSLASAAALGRDFRGCDKNPAMLQFAHSRALDHWQPMSPAAIKESYERYQRQVSGQPEGVEDFSELSEDEEQDLQHSQLVAFLDKKREVETEVAVMVEDFKSGDAARRAAAERVLEEQKALEEAGLA